jgi:hypothetical protein
MSCSPVTLVFNFCTNDLEAVQVSDFPFFMIFASWSLSIPFHTISSCSSFDSAPSYDMILADIADVLVANSVPPRVYYDAP